MSVRPIRNKDDASETIESAFAKQVLAQFVSENSMRDLADLQAALEPISMDVLQKVLASLLKAEKLLVTYRVHSPFGERQAVKDFTSFLEIPEVLEDVAQEPTVVFEVRLSNVAVLFSRNMEEPNR